MRLCAKGLSRALQIPHIIIQGIDAALRERGYPPAEDPKAGEKR
jgi:hypothetical protein